MSTNHLTAIGMLDWTDATALFRIREFLAAFKDRRPKPPAGGGPDEPSEDPPRDNLWDDPALWMLMLH
jgi:hypothetical protein